MTLRSHPPGSSRRDLDPKALRIVCYPDPVLRTRAKPIEAVTDRVRAVARRMIELMHESSGVGLAAPQVGLSWRLFVANPDRQLDQDRAFVNPVLNNLSRDGLEQEEGCLSIPGVNGQIVRPQAVTIDALDLDGNPFQLTGNELSARVWQHETDHLDGVLIIDRMAPIDKMANRRALQDLEKDYDEAGSPTAIRNP